MRRLFEAIQTRYALCLSIQTESEVVQFFFGRLMSLEYDRPNLGPVCRNFSKVFLVALLYLQNEGVSWHETYFNFDSLYNI